MKIGELIKALQQADPECEAYIPTGEGMSTKHIGLSFDDKGDADIYEIAPVEHGPGSKCPIENCQRCDNISRRA